MNILLSILAASLLFVSMQQVKEICRSYVARSGAKLS